MPPMRIFGVKSHHCLEVVPTPSGECSWCNEPIGEGEIGMVLDHYGETVSEAYYHRECLMRSIIGSVEHQKGECSCANPSVLHQECAEEPMSKREAAKAAWEHYEQKTASQGGPLP